MAKSIEEQFWGQESKGKKKNKTQKSSGGIVPYWLIMTFCVFSFLWVGYKLSYAIPLDITEAYADQVPAVPVPQDSIADNSINDNENKQTILVMGSDKRADEPSRSDTIMLLVLDTKAKTIKIINIPRDTYVTIPEKELRTKINHAYAYGGIAMAQDTVENYLNIKIDHYADTDFKGFAALIDALGGVEMDVEKRMYYPEENIDLQAGLQHLNGEQALGYVRFRSDGLGDIGRIERQQKFLPVLADKVMSLSTLWKIPKLVRVFQDNVETDLTIRELLSLGNTYKSFDLSQLETVMLPGEAKYIRGVSYWIGNEEEVAELMDRFMTNSDTGTTAESQKESE